MRYRFTFLCVMVIGCLSTFAQQAANLSGGAAAASVPHLIRFAGMLDDASEKTATQTRGITFALYKEQRGGAPIWSEVQNVKADASGRYTVLLGATKADGVPTDIFISGEAQWLGVQVEGRAEQPRVLLVSVPYALKAAEAETLAGHAASEFVTSDKLTTAVQQQLRQQSIPSGGGDKKSATRTNAPVTDPATNFVDNTTNQVVSVTQNGSGMGILANATTGYAIRGNSTGTAIFGNSTGAGNAALQGSSSSTTGKGIYGYATATSGINYGVLGSTASPQGIGIYGYNNAATGTPIGILGATLSTGGIAIQAQANASSGASTGLLAKAASPSGTALVLQNSAGGNLISGQSGSGNSQVFHIDGGGNIFTNGALLVTDNNTYQPARVQSSSTFGTWLTLTNTAPGGQTWNFLSAGPANGEGAGNLGITNLNGGSIFFGGPVNSGGDLHVNGLARAENGLSLGGNATLSVDAPGIVGGQFKIANGTMSLNGDIAVGSNPRMTFTGFLLGDTGDSGQLNSLLGIFHPDRDIVVTGVYGVVNNKGIGNCSNPSVITVGSFGSSGTPTATLTLYEGVENWQNDHLYVPLTTTYDVAIMLTQNSGGCGFLQHTTQNPVITVEYYMK